ncbi:hypothetical protein RF11_11338 [Thelohanellus kitauei]|uniref:Uncharacterized protein n=1 Tax=Thelohanellus kitauei TaxID=669202 RepID=A0A0C2MHR2_THEKT|nr:hypothetical protein RF11_11338 [Thelohanellus kitauei]
MAHSVSLMSSLAKLVVFFSIFSFLYQGNCKRGECDPQTRTALEDAVAIIKKFKSDMAMGDTDDKFYVPDFYTWFVLHSKLPDESIGKKHARTPGHERTKRMIKKLSGDLVSRERREKMVRAVKGCMWEYGIDILDELLEGTERGPVSSDLITSQYYRD